MSLLPSPFITPLVSILNPLSRFLCRTFPSLRPFLWKRLIQPKLCWRDFPFEVPSETGLLIAGSTVDVIQRYLYYFGNWEPPVCGFIQRSLQPGDVFVDVGANIGYLTLIGAQRVGPQGKVIAIEASEETFAKLRANITRNGMKQVHPIWGAVSDQPGQVTLFKGPKTNSGLASMIRNNEAETEEIVEARPLGQWLELEDISRIRMIKIDVEGAEMLVSRGLVPLLELLPERAEILMEISPALMSEQDQLSLMAIFSKAGFRMFCLPEDSIDAYLYPGKYSGATARLREGLLSERLDVVFSRSKENVL